MHPRTVSRERLLPLPGRPSSRPEVDRGLEIYAPRISLLVCPSVLRKSKVARAYGADRDISIRYLDPLLRPSGRQLFFPGSIRRLDNASSSSSCLLSTAPGTFHAVLPPLRRARDLIRERYRSHPNLASPRLGVVRYLSLLHSFFSFSFLSLKRNIQRRVAPDEIKQQRITKC